MAEDKTIIMPDNQNNGWNNGIPFSIPIGNFGWGNGWGNNGWGGGLFGGSGFGAGILGGILGGLIPGVLGGNGLGNWGNNGGNAAASLGAQATANANTDLIIQAINGTDSDVRLLATTLNSDIDSVRLAINTVQGAIATVGANLGLTGQQVINAIQSGNAAISQQLCQCCCQMQQQVMAQGYENQIRTLQQTETLRGDIADLKSTMIEQFCNQERRELQGTITRQGDIITQLRNEADNARQTNAVAAMLAPIAKEVNDIQCKLPNTVPVTYPNITAVNNTPFTGGYFGNGLGFGFGFGNGLVF